MSGLVPLAAPEFDLAGTLDSGQAFHWSPRESAGHGGFLGAIGDAPVFVAQKADTLLVDETHCERATHYFALDDDIAAIRATFPADDEDLARAVAFCPGLRILRQPAWECLATFITSSLKQVAHIRQISLRLRTEFGQHFLFEGEAVHAYPTPEAIAAAGEERLRECALGYRARSLHLAAERIASGEISLDTIADLDDEAAREQLCAFHGVGAKIANCVLLFAYGRQAAFPVDVWVMRVLEELYFKRRRKKLTPRDIERFVRKHFGNHPGYAQQYLFHYARKTTKKGGSGRR